jgi:hypothetical protein
MIGQNRGQKKYTEYAQEHKVHGIQLLERHTKCPVTPKIFQI